MVLDQGRVAEVLNQYWWCVVFVTPYTLKKILRRNQTTLDLPEQAAEQIVVLDQGRVAEIGTHTDLTQRGGLYANLVSTQSLSLSNV